MIFTRIGLFSLVEGGNWVIEQQNIDSQSRGGKRYLREYVVEGREVKDEVEGSE